MTPFITIPLALHRHCPSLLRECKYCKSLLHAKKKNTLPLLLASPELLAERHLVHGVENLRKDKQKERLGNRGMIYPHRGQQ
mgnify:CR=1 FL=1